MDIKRWFRNGNKVCVPTKTDRAAVVEYLRKVYPKDNYRYVNNTWDSDYQTIGISSSGNWCLWPGRPFEAIDLEEFFDIFDLSSVKSIEFDLDSIL